LIDVAIPSDKNVIQKEAEKKFKYKNLSIEIQKMWNMKCFVMPVIIGATGIVSKSLQKFTICSFKRLFAHTAEIQESV
jgi:3-deoxy-D-manno-octulosonic acid (KDO) 8-phosphate synthase